MSAYSFALICLRVMSVYIFFQMAVSFPMFFIGIEDENAGEIIIRLFTSFIPLVLSFIVAIVFWRFAPFIALKILDLKSGENIESLQANTELNTKSLQATVIVTVGFLFLMFSLPSLLSSIVVSVQFYAELSASELNPYFYNIIESITRVIFSLFLIFGVGFWVRLLHKFKTFGLIKKASN